MLRRPFIVALGSLSLAAAVTPFASAAQQPVRVVPPRPQPPLGAFATMTIPVQDRLGVRQTVNANLTPAQTTANLRSALNVAALNCLMPRHQPILAAYKAFLKTHAQELAAAERAVDRQFREKHGARGYVAARDAYATKVYNYFALPPTMPRFCDAAVAIGNEALLVPPRKLQAFAALALARLEQVFEDFFRSYERYLSAAAAWDAQYGAPMPAAVGAAPAGTGPPAPRAGRPRGARGGW